MNAYQLWKMTANPTDVNKRVKIKKLMSKRGKRLVAKPASYRRVRSLSIPYEQGNPETKLCHVRRYPLHLKTTDTILQRDNKFLIKDTSRPHKSLKKNQSHIQNFIGIDLNEEKELRPSRKLDYKQSHWKLTNTILDDRPLTAPSIVLNEKYPRHRSPKRNRSSAKSLIEYNFATQNDQSFSPRTTRKRRHFHHGATRKYRNVNQTISQPLFVPLKLPIRKPDAINKTRQRIFGF